MPRAEQGIRTTPSLLDRLIDDPSEAHQAHDWYEEIRRLKDSVARDLEALLNTRQEMSAEALEERENLGRSLLTYGLPDFSSLVVTSPRDYERVQRAVAKAIKDFEPRLMNVVVTVATPRDVDRSLRFHIEASLRVEPTPEPVTFDAVMQPETQEYKVQGSG